MTSDIGRLRQIMYQPSACWLSTEYSGDRWLTDQFVLLNVTDEESVEGVVDGPVKLTASNGVQPRDSVPEPDIEAYFATIADADWRPAVPTEWSVAEHPGKAMLWVRLGGYPCLLGETTWAQIKRHYPEVKVHYAHDRNLFRFKLDDTPFCFAAGIQIPDGQEGVAEHIASYLTQLATAG